MLCGKLANLEHVLSSCQSSLADRKFRWHHDKILGQLADGVEQASKRPKELSTKPHFTNFIRPAETAATGQRSKGILASANDWEMQVELKKWLKFTSLRPDMALWSRGTKQVVLIELTVSWEERMEEAH